MNKMILLFGDELKKLKKSGLKFEIMSQVGDVFVVKVDLPDRIWREL